MEGGRAYLNFGADWRKDFTVTIAPQDLKSFTAAGIDPRGYSGKMVRVRGWVQYLNRPPDRCHRLRHGDGTIGARYPSVPSASHEPGPPGLDWETAQVERPEGMDATPPSVPPVGGGGGLGTRATSRARATHTTSPRSVTG